jgi:Ca-activated chloride channel homolog
VRELIEGSTGIVLLEPAWLLAAVAIVVVLALLPKRRRAAVHFARETAEELPRTFRVRLVALPFVLQAVGLLLVGVALARPVRRERIAEETEGIDIVLALDVSSSMSADDMDARRARLEVAKDAAAQFVGGRVRDRIGLLVFARYPEVLCPPTLDHGAVVQFLRAAQTVESDSPEDATGIGAAVARAAEVLRTSPSKSRVVILLTDGAENVATSRTAGEISPADAAQLGAELGVRVYAIAVGTGDLDASGARVASDTKALRRIADRTGARFYEARDAAAVAGVYADIDALEKTAQEEPRWRVEERFTPWLAAATALVLVGMFLRSSVLDVLP